MKAGDIVFIKGNTIISKLIRLFDKGKYSHVVIALSEHLVLEAQYGTKVRITPFRYKIEDCEIVDLELSDDKRKTLSDLALEYTGKQYDYIQALSMAFKGVSFDRQNAYICTEIIRETLIDLGFTCLKKDMKPNELYRFLINHKQNDCK